MKTFLHHALLVLLAAVWLLPILWLLMPAAFTTSWESK